MINIYPEDCLDKDKKIKNESVMLGIYDPPFGIGESKFDKHYKRDNLNIINGYKEAPADYALWTNLWLKEAVRVLNNNGSMYVIIGHTQLRHVLNAASNLNLVEINHLIWKYNFGVYTKKKYVTSHYHILYYKKVEKSKSKFNLNCRFGCQEKDSNGGSKLYHDLEDVFFINKEFSPGEKKNQNKLPEDLIKKLILYSSDPNDLVCDFFMGNFTTAYCAINLGRNICGYEINKESYNYHLPKIKKIKFGSELKTLKKVENIIPLNQGKKISEDEKKNIFADYKKMLSLNIKKKDISSTLQEKYGRGKFAIKNILDKYNGK
jgi:site-specific DNA-methyltransferase (adenine-specific)